MVMPASGSHEVFDRFITDAEYNFREQILCTDKGVSSNYGKQIILGKP